MDLRIDDIIRIIRQRIWFIIIISFLGSLITALVSIYIIPPKYQASTTLLVQQQEFENKITYNDLIANEKLVPTFGLIVKSRKVASQVIKNLNLNISEEKLLKDIEVSEQKDSLVTMITVTNTDPKQAIFIANSFAETFKEILPGIMNVGKISIIDRANLINNAKPISPKPIFNTIVSFILFLNISIGLAVIREVLDKTVKSEELLKQLLGLPILSTIVKYNGNNKNSPVSLFTLKEPKSYIAESFRKLRTNIKYMQVGRKIKTLLITSATFKEGKSFVAANLAISMAQEGKQVLLMDCNLRNPILHKLFNISNDQGLTDLLINKIKTEEAVFSTKQQNLKLIPSGSIPPNPSELLGTQEMVDLIGYFQKQYDIILIDSLPINPVADTQVLVKLSDAVLLTTKLGDTLAESVLQAKSLLDHAGANVIGVVANCKKLNIKKYYNFKE